MQPGDLVPNFTGLSCLAGEVQDFDSGSLNGLYTVLCFYEVIPIFFWIFIILLVILIIPMLSNIN